MIPLHFGYAYWTGEAEEEAGEEKKAVFVPIHAHCWIDHSHVITISVLKKNKDEDAEFSCEQCQVKERTVRCRKRKCLDPVPA